MKKTIIFICLMIFTITSVAQAKDFDFKHSLETGYEWMHLANASGGFERDFNFYNVGYAFSMSPVSECPEFKVGTGAVFAIGTSKNVQYNVVNRPLHVDYTVSYMKFPILASYKLGINEKIDIVPSAGLYMKAYISATTNTYSDDKSVQEAFDYYKMTFGKENKFSGKYPWKRFGCGIQLGGDVLIIKHILAGIHYEYEFTKIDKYADYNFTHGVMIKVGWLF